MSGFYHFVPDVTPDQVVEGGNCATGALIHATLQAVHLDDVLRDCRIAAKDVVVIPCNSGPGDQGGVMLYPHPPGDELPELLGYDGERQQWVHVAVYGRWVGWRADEPPRPEDLERPQIRAGYTVRDDHSQVWQVPIAYASPAGADATYGNLPCSFRFDLETNQPIATLKPEYRTVWERAKRAWTFYNSPADEWPEDFNQDELIMLCAMALAINYRVGLAELNALDAAGRDPLDNDFVRNVVLCLIDMEVANAWKKKETPENGQSAGDGSSCTPGTPDDTPASEPVSAN